MWRIFRIITSDHIDYFTDIKFVSDTKFVLNSLVYDRNIFGSFSKGFGNLRKFSWSEILGKSYHYVYIIQRTYTLARRYEFYVLEARTISHSCAPLTREILFLPLEHKIHIVSPPCNILYLFSAGDT